ncbi:uncharacterized protein LOC144121747 [Amblyomma americanum]
MVLRKDATPVVQPTRRVPLALREPLREELERIQRSGIIERVQKPTDWYVPGKKFFLADMLSRAPGTATKDYSDDTEDVEVHAVAVMSTLVRLQPRHVEPRVPAIEWTR